MGATSGGELVVVHEFPEEAAGDLGGYVDVRQTEDEHALRLTAVVAYARIGEQGASYAYEEINRAPDHQEIPHAVGFGPSVELFVTAQQANTKSVVAKPVMAPRWRRDDFDASFANNLYPTHRPKEETGTWAVGETEIIAALKDQLTARDAMWLYPAIYYTLAQLAEKDDQLADPTMHTMTDIEKRLADYRYRQLLAVQSIDRSIAPQLEEDAGAAHDTVVDAFVTSRREIAELERDADRALLMSAFSCARLFLPVGDVKEGREWPYMDPMASDEQVAFGIELLELAQRRYKKAHYEVGREIKELRPRIDNAQAILRRLESLHDKETKQS